MNQCWWHCLSWPPWPRSLQRSSSLASFVLWRVKELEGQNLPSSKIRNINNHILATNCLLWAKCWMIPTQMLKDSHLTQVQKDSITTLVLGGFPPCLNCQVLDLRRYNCQIRGEPAAAVDRKIKTLISFRISHMWPEGKLIETKICKKSIKWEPSEMLCYFQ